MHTSKQDKGTYQAELEYGAIIANLDKHTAWGRATSQQKAAWVLVGSAGGFFHVADVCLAVTDSVTTAERFLVFVV